MKYVKRIIVLIAVGLGLSGCATGPSVDELRTKANQGDTMSQFLLGIAYDSGRDVQRNPVEAASWYRKAAEQGHADAQNSLGSLYQYGQGVTKDDKEAFRWYQKSADQGNHNALNNLGYMYQEGRGVQQDKAKAVQLYHSAADTGSADATYNLAKSYWRGEGVARDLVQAYMWMDIARFYSLFSPNTQLKWRIRRELDEIGSSLTKDEIKRAQAMGKKWEAERQKRLEEQRKKNS